MKEFKYVFKVDHTNPEETLKKLGLKVVGDVDAFDGVDIEFVQNQDFITAVPVEIALTTELRANLLYHNPGCRFVVTGVPVQRIKNLTDYGYTVLTHLDEQSEDGPVSSDENKDEVLEEELEDVKANEASSVKEEEKNTEPYWVKSYWVDGKEATEEEFNKAAKELKEKIKKAGFLFGNLEDMW